MEELSAGWFANGACVSSGLVTRLSWSAADGVADSEREVEWMSLGGN